MAITTSALTFEGRAARLVLAHDVTEHQRLFAVVVGLPVGVIGVTWPYLRVEAFAGGRGDRFIPGTPVWLRAMPPLAVVSLAIVVTAMVVVTGGRFEIPTMVAANIALVGIYMAIGWFILRTQLADRPAWAAGRCRDCACRRSSRPAPSCTPSGPATPSAASTTTTSTAS